MMLCRTRFKPFICFMIFFGITLVAGLVSAQDASKLNTTTDSKIRNIDGVAAVVNTGYITRKEIDDRIAALKKQGAKLPDDGSVRKVILERLITEKIQLQNAEQEGVVVTNKELDKIIGDIAAKNKLSYTEFKEKVATTGISFEKYKQLL